MAGSSTPARFGSTAETSARRLCRPCRPRAASRPTARSGSGSSGISRNLNDQVDIKVGQQSLDQEFMVTQNGSYFVNTMFGWPMLPSADMPGGGPAYPLSALGVRARAAHRRSVHAAGWRVQRQPGAGRRRRSAEEQRSQRRQLPARAGRARHRRTAIRLSRPEHAGEGRRSRSAGAHLQDRLLVRQRAVRRSRNTTTRAVAREPDLVRHPANRIPATTRSTRSPIR